jgi:hypothetical protein
MMKSASPTPIRTVEEQLRSLDRRRSAIDRLIRALEAYQREAAAPKIARSKRVA